MANKQATRRPNILLITTDEQHRQTLGAYGNPVVNTSNIDRLAREGMVFDRAYCANPLCTPSRSSILTGQYPSRHGAWNVGVKLPKDAPTVSGILAEAGYHTAALGKMHFQPGEAPKNDVSEECGHYSHNPHDHETWTGPYYGFQEARLTIGHTIERHAHGNHYGKWLAAKGADTKRYYDDQMPTHRKETKWEDTLWDLPLEYHNSLWTAEIATDYLKARSKDGQPFFAWVSFQDPHDPYRVPNPYHDRYRPQDVLPFVKKEGEMDDKPPHFRKWYYGEDLSYLRCEEAGGTYGPAGCQLQQCAHDFPESIHRIWNACVYGMVDLIDDQVGRIMETLDELGMTEDTLVIFTTDHGDYMGNHWFWFKGPFHYEDVIRVPMVARMPGGIGGGRRIESLASLMDLAPTFLDLAGVDIPDCMDGRTIAPLLNEQAERVRDLCVVQNQATSKFYLESIITDRHKATFYKGEDYGELYDFQEDPNEFVNLFDSPDHREVRESLREISLKEQTPEREYPPRVVGA